MSTDVKATIIATAILLVIYAAALYAATTELG